MIKDFIAEMRKNTEEEKYCTINFSPEDVRDFRKVLDIAAAETKDAPKREAHDLGAYDFSGEAKEILRSIGAKKAIIEVSGKHLQSINIYGILGEDETKKYNGMIQAIECDFAIAADPKNRRGLDDLQVQIENNDARLLNDIELLKSLSYGLRSGKLLIVKRQG